jgi:hypothetical protein
MEALHKINKWSFIITLVLYITVYSGMLAQLILGPIQLIIAAIISIKYFKILSYRQRHQIKVYWLLVTIAGLLLIWVKFYNPYFSNDFFLIVTLFVFPMFIALYFVYLTSEIKNQQS